MANILIIVVGLIFALIGYRKGWYPSWAMLFNVLVAVYISIMLTPQIVNMLTFARNYLDDYSYAAFVLIFAIIIYLILDIFSFRFFTGVSNIPFPKFMNNGGAAVLGFLTGACLTGFLLFVITITPLSNYKFVKALTHGRSAGSANCAVIASCNFVHSISLQPIPDASEKQFELITGGWEKRAGGNEPNAPSDTKPVQPLKPRISDADVNS